MNIVGPMLLSGVLLVTELVCVAKTPPVEQPKQQPGTCCAQGFDVVSIKQTKENSDNVLMFSREDGFNAQNVHVAALLNYAFDAHEYQIIGLPDWARSTTFDVVGKFSDPNEVALKKATLEEREEWVAKILVERFHLVSHKEKRVMPVYDLTVSKDGFKAKQSQPATVDQGHLADSVNPQQGMLYATNRSIFGKSAPFSDLAPLLSGIVNRSVIDKTGVTGSYDIKLVWTPEQAMLSNAPQSSQGPPDIYTALQQQLGLRLSSSKAPVDVLVIDSISFPIAN
ncbi:TIGR03435 family protein [Terriglobus albidus]|nr:TIGR03435 family protein [Terriglobus albidus]